jgi:hypothetical protein
MILKITIIYAIVTFIGLSLTNYSVNRKRKEIEKQGGFAAFIEGKVVLKKWYWPWTK